LFFIAYGSLIPPDNESARKIFQFNIPDKLVHAAFYFLLTLSFMYPTILHKVNTHMNMVAAFSIIFGYGILMEILQYYFIEGRSGEILDVLANTGGIVLAFLLAFLFKNKIQDQTV
jgi:VanZ family protein